jgi:hypothetical protein
MRPRRPLYNGLSETTMKEKHIALAVLLIVAPAMAQDALRDAAIDRRANNIRALLGIADPAQAQAVRQGAADYYMAAHRSDEKLIGQLSAIVPEKVAAEKQYLTMLLAMPLTGTESNLPAAETQYTTTIAGRADRIMPTLEVSDPAKAQAVRELIINQFRALRDNDAIRDAKLKVSGNSGPAADAVKQQTLDARKILHDAYLASLSQHLSPEQVEKVKDGHTPNKVAFTYQGYLNEYPDMNEAQEAKVMELLKEARELAMDGGSSGEKDAIFNKYKGKINNWLSAQGVKSRRQVQREAQAATQPARP